MAIAGQIIYLNPRAIEPNRENIRREPGDLVGLAETIREHGILQPLGVVVQGDGYRVVYGDRRREAAIVVGLDRVPCLSLGNLAPEDRLIHNLLENLQRLDLNDMEKAKAFERMRDNLMQDGLDRSAALDAMTRRLGLSASQIKRYLGLLDLSPRVQAMVAAGDIGVTQAQHLRALTPPARQEAVAQLAADENLSAAELARLAAAVSRNANIEPSEALMLLRRGESVSDLAERERAGALHLPPAPPQRTEDADLTEDPPGEEDAALESGNQRAGNGTVTRDGNRVRKIHSLDSFMDEVDRLARCLQDGDLAKLIAADPEGTQKVILAAKQLGFLARGVGEMAGLNP